MKSAAILTYLAQRLQEEVAAGRYASAQNTLAQYSSAVREAAVSACGGEDRTHLLQEALDLLEGCRRRTLANRAHATARRARVAGTQAAGGYATTVPLRRARRWVG